MVYFHAHMKVKPGKLAEFQELLGTVVPIVGKHGWKLIGSFVTQAGAVHTVVDLWELPDANAFYAGLNDEELHKLNPVDDDLIEWETRTLMSHLPIAGESGVAEFAPDRK